MSCDSCHETCAFGHIHQVQTCFSPTGTCISIGGPVDRSPAFVAVPLQTDEKLLQTLSAAAAASATSSSSSSLSTSASGPSLSLTSKSLSTRANGHGLLRIWDGIGNGFVDAADALQAHAYVFKTKPHSHHILQLHLGSSVPPCPEVLRFLCRNYSIASPTLVDAAETNAIAASEAGLSLLSALWRLLACIFTKEQYQQLVRHTQAAARKAAGT